MGYYVETHESYLRWKEDTNLDEVANVIRQTFFTDAGTARWAELTDVYDMLGYFFDDVSPNVSVPRLFYVDKDNKLGDEEELLAVLAPYLEDESYLRYRGSDGELFGWSVWEGNVTHQYARIEWVDDDED